MTQRVTFYVAAPIARRDDGTILCDDDGAVECQNAESAVCLAELMARTPGYIGAWAFSRSGYPELGHYEPAEVLMRCGSFYWSPKDGAWIV